MTEQVHRFGPDEGLVGVRTEPVADRAWFDSPTVLWLNAGLLPSVGPFGWYVTLARRLARQGIGSFRFDLSGIGDSTLRTDGRDNLERGVADVTAAMDFLGREFGSQRFALVGLCSGAVLAHHVAARDDRVAGAVFMDGCGYRTTGYYLRHYWQRVSRWRAWFTAARRLTGRPAGGAPGESLEDRRLRVQEYYLLFPDRGSAREQLAAVVRRGARLLFLYSGAAKRYFNHQRQFGEMFGALDPGGQVEVDYLPTADHLYSGREQRHMMFDRVEDWFRRMP